MKWGIEFMKIENLKEGQIIKNYKELCTLLDIKVTSGNAKKSQLKDLERFISYEKENYKFIIKEIYNQEKVKKIGIRNKYIEEIQNILVEYLYRETRDKKGSIILSLGNFLEILGMVNNNYAVGNRHKKELSQVLDINLFGVYYFYMNTRNEFKSIIERSLNNLQSRRVLNWRKQLIIFKDTIVALENGNTEISKSYVKATEEEEKRILDIEKNALEDLGLRNMKEVFLKNKTRAFQKEVKRNLPIGWKYYYYSYDLTVGDVAVEIELKNILKDKKSLNDKIKERTATKLKLIDEDEEYKLIDALIDIFKYDFRIEGKIKEKIIENREKKDNEIKKCVKQIKALDSEKEILKERINNLHEDEEDDNVTFEDIKKYKELKESSYDEEKEDQLTDLFEELGLDDVITIYRD